MIETPALELLKNLFEKTSNFFKFKNELEEFLRENVQDFENIEIYRDDKTLVELSPYELRVAVKGRYMITINKDEGRIEVWDHRRREIYEYKNFSEIPDGVKKILNNIFSRPEVMKGIDKINNELDEKVKTLRMLITSIYLIKG
jgi:hypothetical protein